MTVYLVGNEMVPDDSVPLQLAPVLSKTFHDCTFLPIDPTENFIPEPESIIIDTVQGIQNVIIFSDVEVFADHAMVSPHDYDLLFHLKLLKKLGKLTSLTIIGVPMGKTANEVIAELVKVLELALHTIVSNPK